MMYQLCIFEIEIIKKESCVLFCVVLHEYSPNQAQGFHWSIVLHLELLILHHMCDS